MHPSITRQLVEEHHCRLHAELTPHKAAVAAAHPRRRHRDKVGTALIRWGTRLSAAPAEPARGGVETWTTCGATSR